MKHLNDVISNLLKGWKQLEALLWILIFSTTLSLFVGINNNVRYDKLKHKQLRRIKEAYILGYNVALVKILKNDTTKGRVNMPNQRSDTTGSTAAEWIMNDALVSDPTIRIKSVRKTKDTKSEFLKWYDELKADGRAEMWKRWDKFGQIHMEQIKRAKYVTITHKPDSNTMGRISSFGWNSNHDVFVGKKCRIDSYQLSPAGAIVEYNGIYEAFSWHVIAPYIEEADEYKSYICLNGTKCKLEKEEVEKLIKKYEL